MIGIVILAMVAAFLALRLYAVLGKRTGHEQTIVRPVDATPAVVPLQADAPRAIASVPNENVFEPGAAAGLRAIAAVESSFDVGRFVEGAKAAYRMVLEAFWRGDEEELSHLTDADVLSAFSAAIAERKTAGHVLDNRLVNIEKAVISDASLDGKTARITVRFDADIAAVTRDAEGVVLAGSVSDATPTHDAWTFTRMLKSADPNWILTDTDESA